MPISLPEIEAAAHSGAFGKNRIPEPTENQCNAGNYKMGRFDYHGLKIVIEQPRGTYRTGIDQKTGKRWTSRMAAHYGYIGGTKGSDGDGVDCFVGFYPQSEHVFVINQNVNGRFDEHKTMLAFPDQDSAIRAYKQSYDRDWDGLESIVQLSINQLKWWLKNGDMRRPIKQADLPAEGFETMKRVYWNENNMPLDGRTLDRVLYEMRQSDEDNLLLDSVSLSEILEDAEGGVMLDALVTPFVKLERKMSILQGIMERSASQIKPVAMQISDPFKQNGVVNVAVVYELSDGQTISIYFHNPDVTPQKIAPTDEVISWKWMLNKKDITIVVAPERGRDLDVREVAMRILKLAEKNSAAFARANAKRAERMQNIQNLKDEIVTLEGELKSAQNELEVLKIEIEGRAAGGGLIIPDEEQQALKRRGDAARAILENMDADQLAKVGASPALRSVVTLKLGVNRAIDDILENHPDDVETAIASVVSGSGESEETSTDSELALMDKFRSSAPNSEVEWRVSKQSSRSNFVLITPAKFGGTFSAEEIDALSQWLKPFGFGVIKETSKGGSLRVIAGKGVEWARLFVNRTAEIGTAIAAISTSNRNNGVVSPSEGDGKEVSEKESEYAGLPSRDWVESHFGSVANDFNKLSLARYLDDKADSFNGMINHRWIDSILKILPNQTEERINGMPQNELFGLIKNAYKNFKSGQVGDGVDESEEITDPSDLGGISRKVANMPEDELKALRKYSEGSNSGMKSPLQVTFTLDKISDSFMYQIKLIPGAHEKYKFLKDKVTKLPGIKMKIGTTGRFQDSIDLNRAIKDGKEFGYFEVNPRKGYTLITLAIDLAAKPKANSDNAQSGEPEEITAAKSFLKSVIDGAKDASDLMNLLDEIDASAKALIDAGKGDEYDELIGRAAEKWAELDQQANG